MGIGLPFSTICFHCRRQLAMGIGLPFPTVCFHCGHQLAMGRGLPFLTVVVCVVCRLLRAFERSTQCNGPESLTSTVVELFFSLVALAQVALGVIYHHGALLGPGEACTLYLTTLL